MIPLDSLKEGACYRLGVHVNNHKQFIDCELVELLPAGRKRGLLLSVNRLGSGIGLSISSRWLFDIRRLNRKHA